MQEDEKYTKMLAQMGLAAEHVDSEMRDTLYQKLNLQKPEESSAVTEKKRKVRREKQKEERKTQAKLASIKESDILHTDAIGGSEKLTLGDLFQSLDAQKMEGKEFSALAQS